MEILDIVPISISNWFSRISTISSIFDRKCLLRKLYFTSEQCEPFPFVSTELIKFMINKINNKTIIILQVVVLAVLIIISK